MTDYEQLVEALRICGKGSCVDCDRQRQDKCLKRHWNNENMIDGMLCEAAAAIEALQAETVRLWPKRGKWINSKERMRPDMCSVCGCVYEADRFMDKIAWNYCPNCGAKMEVEDGQK